MLVWVLWIVAPQPIELVFGGDVAFGRVVAGQVRPIGGSAPLAGVVATFTSADLAFVNLECALSDAPPQSGGVRLVASPAAAAHLAAAGIDVVSLANNHALDAGVAGLETTRAALAAAGVVPIGAGPDGAATRPHVVTIRGTRVAWLAATDRQNATARATDRSANVAYLPPRALEAELTRRVAAADADIVIVSIHWGQELRKEPTLAQRDLARALVAAGANIVVGHHSHVVQPMERVGDGIVFYSLGNLLFDMREPRAREGALARVRVAMSGGKARIVESTFLPTVADPGTDSPQLVRPVSGTGPTGTLRADLDGDRRPDTVYFHANAARTLGALTVQRIGKPSWTSGIYPAWAARTGRLDAGAPAFIVLGAWTERQIHRGPPVQRAIWVLAWEGGAIVDRWRGSALARPFEDFRTGDLDRDGVDELYVLERLDVCRVTAYRWNGFGFQGLGRLRIPCDGAELCDDGVGCVASADGRQWVRLDGERLFGRPRTQRGRSHGIP